ncbi:MAG: hypothetical protein QM323_12625 [Acidobacteriota bacterium]|nr:hypothetical protein [Acidobacteriota bacterium]
MTLMELPVVVLIAGIFFAAVPVFVHALRVTRDDTVRVTAQTIARHTMERIRHMVGDVPDPAAEGYMRTASTSLSVAYTIAVGPDSASSTAVHAHNRSW